MPEEQPLETTDSNRSSLPVGIKLIAGINILGAILALPHVLWLFSLNHQLAPVIGIGFSLLVGVGLGCTYGLLTYRYWGWLGIVGFHTISFIVNVASIDLLGTIPSVIAILYLFSKQNLYL